MRHGQPDSVEAYLARDRIPYWLRARLLVEVVATYVRVRRLLAGHDIARVVTLLRDGEGDRLAPETAQRLAGRLARPLVRTLGPLPVDSRCLMRSLVLIRMMARRGARCELAIGAQSGATFAAHAWVEHAGRPVLPTYGYAVLTVI